MIEINNITKSFDDFTALNNVTCRINDGCIYGMVGSNGAGKSTFLRVLTGIYKADNGEVLYDGANVYDNPAVKEQLVFVADELFFLPGASMKKMAEYYSTIYEAFDNKRFEHLTKEFKLDPKKAISSFSKGMKRQAAIILALSAKPKYLFFDETFDGLDPVMRLLVKKLICKDVADYNATAIITSHSLRELEDICDHLALLHKGGLVLDSDIINLKTSQFKVQIGFGDVFDKERFNGLDITRYQQEGSIANMIINGDHDETLRLLQDMNPLILDVLPLTLEEIFTYEMESLGYEFDIDIDQSETTGGSNNE